MNSHNYCYLILYCSLIKVTRYSLSVRRPRYSSRIFFFFLIFPWPHSCVYECFGPRGQLQLVSFCNYCHTDRSLHSLSLSKKKRELESKLRWMSERHFVWGPRSRWAEGPGIKEKGLGEWWKQLFIFCHFLHERRVTPWAAFTEVGRCVCGLRGLVSSPQTCSWNTAPHSVPATPGSRINTCCSGAQWRGIDLPHVSVSLCFCQCSHSAKRCCRITFLGPEVCWDVLGLKYGFTVTCFFLSVLNICFLDDDNGTCYKYF